MRIRHFLYNAFIIESGETKIAIDPGIDLWILKLGRSLIPNEEWKGLTHICITHGDPDHVGAALKIAKDTGAQIISGIGLKDGSKELNKAVLTKAISDLVTVKVGEKLTIDQIEIEGLEAKHGPLSFDLIPGVIKIIGELYEADQGGFRIYMGPVKIGERKKPMKVRSRGTTKFFNGLFGYEIDNISFANGSIGFKIIVGDTSIVNLGDTFLLDSWKGLKPDMLMLPIGGQNTMSEKEALEAVKAIQPKRVIPSHYNCGAFFKKHANPADDQMFKQEVEKMGIECYIMNHGDTVDF
jgi:L-ascorbate metabolism protein UlaG (beta-lactamase superfamily)